MRWLLPGLLALLSLLAAIPARSATDFYTVAPCRILDTVNNPGPLGGPALPANGSHLAASADGQYVAYDEGKRLFAWSEKGSIELPVQGDVLAVTFSADSRTLHVLESKRVVSYDLRTHAGTQRAVGFECRSPQLLPNGTVTSRRAPAVTSP